MNNTTERYIRATQQRYKRYLDKHVHRTTKLESDQHEYVDRASKATQTPAEHIEEAPHTKLLRRTMGTIEVL